MTDVRQSPQFANFMKDIGWRFEKINYNYIYLRKFPIIGHFAKIPRFKLPLDLVKLNKFLKVKRIFKLKLAPFILETNNDYRKYKNYFIRNGYKIDQSPFTATTTILIDLTKPEKEIFNNFSQAKRRAVRKSIKNNIMIHQSSDIESFIKIRNKQLFPLGLLMTGEMKKLWDNFSPKNVDLLLAYHNNPSDRKSQMQAIASICYSRPLAGILLLYYNKIAYYWYASALKEGKKLFAPTLLVWEALKLAKKMGCKVFDFEGIYDERFPKSSQSWKGFTKFKEGFGGKKVVFMENFMT